MLELLPAVAASGEDCADSADDSADGLDAAATIAATGGSPLPLAANEESGPYDSVGATLPLRMPLRVASGLLESTRVLRVSSGYGAGLTEV